MTDLATTDTRSRRPGAGSARPAAVAAGRDQALVAGAQVAAGLGNLLFVAVAARVLPAEGFGHLAAFVALLAVLNLPGAGLAAAGALSPRQAGDAVRRVAALGIGAGVVMAVLAVPMGHLLGLPVGFVLALAAAAPAAPLLGLRRGLAYGSRDHLAVVRSLVAEPAARIVLGLAAGLAIGPIGAAAGVAVGGWLALVSMGPLPRRGSRSAGHAAATGAVATALAFVGVAFLQQQDLILANRLLDGADAGAFAAISAIGGMVAFATATLPLVLLPAVGRDERDERGGVQVALALASLVAVGAVVVAAVGAELLVSAVVGDRFVHVAPLLPPYMAAMGALGVGRVAAAHRCARGEGRAVASIVAVVVAAQALAIVAWARTPGQFVAVTTSTLVLGAVVVAVPSRHVTTARTTIDDRLRAVAARPDARLVAALTVVAVLVRIATERSIWVDEAISIRQAQLPLGEMLADLRTTDVHPPLHFLVLWLSVRVAGTAEWAVRLPSLVFGVALVPVMYGAGRELFDRRTAQVAAALAVPAPFLVWYSQEARMYSLFMLVGVVGVWAQVAALRRGQRAAFIAWGVASAALIWTQWFAFLPLAVQQVVTIVHLVRCRLDGDLSATIVRRWLGSVLLTGLLVLPLLPFLSTQLAAYGRRGAGLELPGSAGTDASSVAEGLSAYAAIANALWAVGGYHDDGVMVRLGAMWPLAMLGCLLLLGRRLQRSTALLLAVAIVPAVVLFVVAHTKRDLFELRYFVLSAPLLLLVVARAATIVARRRVALAGLVAVLLGLSSVALVDQQLNGTNPRLYDFRGAVAEIEATAGPDDVIAHTPGYLADVLHYYAPEMRTAALGSFHPDDVDGQVYVVVTERFLTPATSGRIGDELARLEQERGAPQRIERPNVVVWRFS